MSGTSILEILFQGFSVRPRSVAHGQFRLPSFQMDARSLLGALRMDQTDLDRLIHPSQPQPSRKPSTGHRQSIAVNFIVKRQPPFKSTRGAYDQKPLFRLAPENHRGILSRLPDSLRERHTVGRYPQSQLVCGNRKMGDGVSIGSSEHGFREVQSLAGSKRCPVT